MNNLDIYKKYKWEAVAEDFNSPLFRNYIWVGAFHGYPRLFNLPVTAWAILSKKNKITYLSDLSTWKKTHDVLVARVNKNHRLIEKYILFTNKLGEKMNKWSEREIYHAELSLYPNKKLISLLEGVIERSRLIYSYGVLLPMLDFGELAFIEGSLDRFLKSKVKDEEYGRMHELFTTPSHNSFSQDQEEALLGLISKYDSPKWRKTVLEFGVVEIKKLFPKFWKDLIKHSVKWGWVYYVYTGPAFKENEFLGFIRSNLEKNIVPEKKLEEFKTHRIEVKEMKDKLFKSLKPNSFEKAILKLSGKIVWAKPRRKDYQSKTYFHSEKLLEEIGKRLSVNVDAVRSTPPILIKEYLTGKSQLDKKFIQSVYEFHVCLPCEDGSVEVLYGKEAKNFEASFFKKEEYKASSQEIKELKGSPACRGKACGIVRIINMSEDMSKMNQGDILVSIATTPSIVPAMKKASAIITDEGGLTCHAAIVSRELGTPCVVGTKIATKVLKDGDLVEVDAGRGLVTILKRK